jgi:hypothetical protein
MENSILTSTKQILGVNEDYDVFDLDIITHINSSFAIANQLGVGPDGFMIEDDLPEWSSLQIPQEQINLLRSYVFLRVRMLFDPPTTSFHLDVMKNQIQEFEHRLSYFREGYMTPDEIEEVDLSDIG